MILFTDYFLIFVFLALAVVLACVIYLLSYILALQKADGEKVSPYECGFDPFDDARHKFDVRFYLVAILFIIFDLEISFLFPWALTLNQQSIFGFVSMFIFLLILTVGFVYEWKKGALDWN